MTPSTFAAILEDRLKHIEDAVALIDQGEGGTPELNSVRGHLIDILERIERNPGIEAAADDLYDVAAGALVGNARERQRTGRGRRVLREAILRFKERLATAQPTPRARS